MRVSELPHMRELTVSLRDLALQLPHLGELPNPQKHWVFGQLPHFPISGPGATSLGAALGAIACGACAPLAGFSHALRAFKVEAFLKKSFTKKLYPPSARTRFYLSIRRGLQPPLRGANCPVRARTKTFIRLRAFGPTARTRFHLSIRRGFEPPVSPAGSVGPGRSPLGTRTPWRESLSPSTDRPLSGLSPAARAPLALLLFHRLTPVFKVEAFL